MKHLWSDLKLFIIVARTKSLSEASRQCGQSPATLGRRMLALEKATNHQLFHRHARGYELTRDGTELLEMAERAEAEMSEIEKWRSKDHSKPTIRLTAGSWTTLFLTQNINLIWQVKDPFLLSFIQADHKLDLGRREAEIGIRNAPPSSTSMAGQKLGPVAFASYASPQLVERYGVDALPWIAPANPTTPSARWLEQTAKQPIVMTASSIRNLLDLANVGIGQVVLPCFIGDQRSGLLRVSKPIEELAHHQWLVMHHEDRFEKQQRELLSRLRKLLNKNRRLIAGELST
ncbi:LysR family transcriptional regulator [Polycladidibacter stylochi]|uniref:LysR family transcriptional regulator n=1 Tax=Polycladidibacter stylochi TaxID=1807766 RepID=UPI00138F776A|nr:LysR family transcriptional regulator [Pseudovibrio stylochi]